jgi:hypothetical protein
MRFGGISSDVPIRSIAQLVLMPTNVNVFGKHQISHILMTTIFPPQKLNLISRYV